MTDIKNILFELSEKCCIGNIDTAAVCAEKMLCEYMDTKRKIGNTVVGIMKGEKDYTVMVEAHIDEIGFVVTDISDDGFLTVKNCGAADIRTLPAKPVLIHAKSGEIKGVFCSVPPHLKTEETVFDDISKLKIDTLLGSKAKDFISLGDFVTYDATPKELLGSFVTGKSFDDRACVAIIIELAKRLAAKKLPVNVAFVLSDAEELGTRGAVTAAYGVSTDEAIALDVSFGDAPDVSADECGKLSRGGMIGVSPTLDVQISKRLADIAKENNIPFQFEIMSGRTGTDADVIAVSKSGVKTGLVSVPLRNMHTDTEIVDIKDLESVCDMLEKYILSSGD